MKNLIFKTTLSVGALLFFSLVAFAQDGPPGPPEPVPVDGGLAFLAAAGIGYGVRKYMKSKNNS